MTPRDFCCWLQGFFEITHAGEGDTPKTLNAHKVGLIRSRLGQVTEEEPAPPADTRSSS